jgi:hypothetical protein
MGQLMYPQQRLSNLADTPTEQERHHAALAYARTAGNLDIDRDPQRPALSAPSLVSD